MLILVALLFMENPSPFSGFRGALLKSGKGCCFVLAVLGFLSSVVIVVFLFFFFNLGKNFLICFNYFFIYIVMKKVLPMLVMIFQPILCNLTFFKLFYKHPQFKV